MWMEAQTAAVSSADWCVAGEITLVNIKVIAVQAQYAVICWDKFNTSDERQLLSWIVNYREA